MYQSVNNRLAVLRCNSVYDVNIYPLDGPAYADPLAYVSGNFAIKNGTSTIVPATNKARFGAQLTPAHAASNSVLSLLLLLDNLIKLNLSYENEKLLLRKNFGR